MSALSGYTFFINKVPLPIPPSSMTIQTPNRNETIDLISGSQVNILKEPGLKEIQFEFLIPQIEYPFANYPRSGRFRKAELYIKEFEALKQSKKPFQFIVSRYVQQSDIVKGKIIRSNSSFNTNLKVSLEEFSQLEDAVADGLDFRFSISLKEYVEHGTKEFVIENKPVDPDEPTLVTIIPKVDDPLVVRPLDPDRPCDPVPLNTDRRRTYTVKSGDSLWAICARELGSGGKCWDAAKKNSISDPGTIKPGQVIDLTGL